MRRNVSNPTTARERERAAHRHEQVPPRFLDRGQRVVPRDGGGFLVKLDPLGGNPADLVGCLRERSEQERDRFVFAAGGAQRDHLIGAG